MARRRPPPKRPSSIPSSLTRKNSDTRRLVNPGPSFTGTEMTGFVRAILLGALVAGVVAFLFYPDISRLLQHWEIDTAVQQPDLPNAKAAKSNGGNTPEAGQAKTDPKTSRKVRSVKENKSTSTSKSTSTTSNGDGSPPKKAKAPKRAEAPPPQETEETLECTCQQTNAPEPPTPPPPKKVKTNPKKTKPPVKTDLMEDEEEEVEEDSEVELMEIEEPIEFIELEAEEEVSPDSTGPVSLKDGEAITFTPLSPGDEDVIRLGGRPKDGKQASSSREKRHSDKPKPDASGTSSSAKNSSAKNDTSTTKSKKPHTANSSDKDSRNSSQKQNITPQESKSQKSTESQANAAENPENEDLPEEVRNFKPTFLKTFTPKKIFADGRRIPPVELIPQKDTNSTVKVFLFNDFLSDAECDGLRRVHDKHVQEMNTQPLLCFDSISTLRKHLDDVRHKVHVTPQDFVKGTKCLNETFSQQLGQWMSGNWSYSTAFYPGESRFSTIFEKRVQQAMGLDPLNGGKFQITSYPQGKAYKAHCDRLCAGRNGPKGPRLPVCSSVCSSL
ncbi:transcriptional regulator ATRX homolog isoform X2 [Littorina saxatilis]|uniref:transcriptional regulator ATRX homolog isoform X2 n=1 Tax=Littorina saxatilis TaxID=31220 RepID=UPI0038B6AF5B